MIHGKNLTQKISLSEIYLKFYLKILFSYNRVPAAPNHLEGSPQILDYPKALKIMNISQAQNCALGFRNRNADSDKEHSSITDQFGWASCAGQIECESIRA
jgi:hypothetical protein